MRPLYITRFPVTPLTTFANVSTKHLSDAPLAVIRPLDWTVRNASHVGGAPSGADGFIAHGRYRPLETYKSGGHLAYYPADRDDVVKAVKSGVRSVQRTSYDDWEMTVNIVSRLRAKMRRMPVLGLAVP
jgi:hypothetical protein